MPLIIEAGFDAWEGQDSTNDKKAIADIHKKVDEPGVTGRFACRLRDNKADRAVNLAEELSRYSRICLAEMAERA